MKAVFLTSAVLICRGHDMKKKNKGFIFAYSVVVMMIVAVLITVILSMSQAGAVKNNLLQAKINARNALDQTAEYFIGEYVKNPSTGTTKMESAAKKANYKIEPPDANAESGGTLYTLLVKSSNGKIMLRVKVLVDESKNVTVKEYVYSPTDDSTQNAG